MLTIISTAIAATTLGAPGHHYTTYYPSRNDGRHLATARPYPANIVDSTARPGFNGRVWIGREIVGGQAPIWRADWCSPGPAAYGAPEHNNAVVYTRVNTLTIPVNPWCELSVRDGDKQYERGRVQWLKEQNYTGGVRTFVHPSRIVIASDHHAHASHRRHITPRATIRPVHPVTRRTPIRVDSRGVRCVPFAGQDIRIVKPCQQPNRRIGKLVIAY